MGQLSSRPNGQKQFQTVFWDTKEDVEPYNRTGYQEVLKALSNVIDGMLSVRTFEFATSTFHRSAAAVTGKLA
jgi:hypothetical protein